MSSIFHFPCDTLAYGFKPGVKSEGITVTGSGEQQRVRDVTGAGRGISGHVRQRKRLYTTPLKPRLLLGGLHSCPPFSIFLVTQMGLSRG